MYEIFHHRLLAGRVHARRESIEEEDEEEMVEEEEVAERDSGMGSEDSQAGSNERLLPPMEPSARYLHHNLKYPGRQKLSSLF